VKQTRLCPPRGSDMPKAAAEAPHGAAPAGGGLKVIGTGLGRTGTSSLKAALEILYPGQKCYHM